MEKKLNLEHAMWIEISLVLSASSSAIIKGKREMQEHAEKLRWIIDIDKKGYVDSSGIRRYEIKLKPKDKFVSPHYLFENNDLILGSAQEMMFSVLDINSDQQIKGNYVLYKDKDNVRFNLSYGGIFQIDCDLKKAIELENEEPNLSKKIFFISFKEDYLKYVEILNKRFSNKKTREDAQLKKEYFEEAGMKKITLEKKRKFDFS